MYMERNPIFKLGSNFLNLEKKLQEIIRFRNESQTNTLGFFLIKKIQVFSKENLAKFSFNYYFSNLDFKKNLQS
jgi:hypothetical protein